MMVSTGVIRRQSGELHALGAGEALALVGQQMGYVVAAIFAVVFSNMDSAISRF